MRLLERGVLTAMMIAGGMAAPVWAQTAVEASLGAALPTPSSNLFELKGSIAPSSIAGQVIQPPAGPPPTPEHTGIKALVTGLIVDFKYLPSRENLVWAGVGGGLALAVHPVDDNLNEFFVGNDFAEAFFKPGKVIGAFPTLLGSAVVVYAVGRLQDKPKVSHLGMDLIQSLAMSEALTQTLKFTTGRERPDGSNHRSFPSGHASDTFAVATAIERHLGWRYVVPAYAVASYVAISRLPANRHWFSDVVFGASVGIIAGRTVTSHEASRPFPVAVSFLPGGLAVMYTRLGN